MNLRRSLFSLLVFSLVSLSFTSPGSNMNFRPEKREGLFSHAPSATFSYKLDGTVVSGGEVDQLMINNAVYVTKSSGNPDKLVFFLSDNYNETSSLFAHSLRFTVPDKQGAVSIVSGDDNWQVEFFLAASGATQYSMYSNEAFTVNLTSIGSSRVTGTFSGKLKRITGDSKAEFSISEGKFDLPVRTQH